MVLPAEGSSHRPTALLLFIHPEEQGSCIPLQENEDEQHSEFYYIYFTAASVAFHFHTQICITLLSVSFLLKPMLSISLHVRSL